MIDISNLFVLFVEGRNRPSKIHISLDSAKTEAIRLFIKDNTIKQISIYKIENLKLIAKEKRKV